MKKRYFVPNAFECWKASQKTGDYHDNMNNVNFTKLLEEKLIPNLKPNSVIITDNAPYHNFRAEKIPTSNNTKEQMKIWLKEKNIPFDESCLKIELYDLIKNIKKNLLFLQ